MQRFTSTLSVNFYCRESKKGKDGLSPVEMAINVNGERFFVNLPRKADSRLFPRLMNQRQASPLREHLMAIERAVMGYETRLLMEGKTVCAAAFKEFIRNGYTCPTENVGYLLDQFRSYVEGKGVSKGVVRKYQLVCELFCEHCHISMEDHLDTITKGKVRDFAEWVMRNYKPSSASGMLTKLKGVFIYAEENRLIQVNPFRGYKIKRTETDVQTITEEEYEKLLAVLLRSMSGLSCPCFNRCSLSKCSIFPLASVPPLHLQPAHSTPAILQDLPSSECSVFLRSVMLSAFLPKEGLALNTIAPRWYHFATLRF